jgi:hypothetical protein
MEEILSKTTLPRTREIKVPVHCLEGRHTLVNLHHEHVLLVVVPVPRRLPEFTAENIWRDD